LRARHNCNTNDRQPARTVEGRDNRNTIDRDTVPFPPSTLRSIRSSEYSFATGGLPLSLPPLPSGSYRLVPVACGFRSRVGWTGSLSRLLRYRLPLFTEEFLPRSKQDEFCRRSRRSVGQSIPRNVIAIAIRSRPVCDGCEPVSWPRASPTTTDSLYADRRPERRIVVPASARYLRPVVTGTISRLL